MNKNVVLMSLVVFLLFVTFIIIGVLLLYLFAKKRGRRDAFYSIRKNFNKNHPIISKLITIIPTILLSSLFLWHISTHMRDLLSDEVLICEGRVIDVSSGYLFNNYVHIDDGTTVINYRNNFDIELGKSYVFYYAPNTKIIMKIEPDLTHLSWGWAFQICHQFNCDC